MSASIHSTALRRLATREQSSAEMVEFLRKKGFSADEAHAEVSKLVEESLIDDLRYARVMARHHSFRDKGPMYIRMSLRTKGVDISARQARQIFEEVTGDSEEQVLARILEKRYESPEERDSDKTYASLLRRGFTAEAIAKVLRRSA